MDNIHIHPASFRNEIIQASRQGLEDIQSTEGEESEHEEAVEDGPNSPSEHSKLLKHAASNGSVKPRRSTSNQHLEHQKGHPEHRHDSWHLGHKHAQPKAEDGKDGHGHSHGDLNMRGVFLHVMGDALGNIGVIASALLIWLTSWSWRFYFDPAISLVITVIILGSAIPLCKAASRILLQAVPVGLSVDDIREDIEELPGVISCHHLHVWQLSDTQLVASLHIQVDCEIKGEGSASYMHLARQVRRCLHEYGIHSSTIQPEFFLDEDLDASGKPSAGEGAESPSGTGRGSDRPKLSSKQASRAESLHSEPGPCLLDCGDECASKSQCCPLKGNGK